MPQRANPIWYDNFQKSFETFPESFETYVPSLPQKVQKQTSRENHCANISNSQWFSHGSAAWRTSVAHAFVSLPPSGVKAVGQVSKLFQKFRNLCSKPSAESPKTNFSGKPLLKHKQFPMVFAWLCGVAYQRGACACELARRGHFFKIQSENFFSKTFFEHKQFLMVSPSEAASPPGRYPLVAFGYHEQGVPISASFFGFPVFVVEHGFY